MSQGDASRVWVWGSGLRNPVLAGEAGICIALSSFLFFNVAFKFALFGYSRIGYQSIPIKAFFRSI